LPAPIRLIDVEEALGGYSWGEIMITKQNSIIASLSIVGLLLCGSAQSAQLGTYVGGGAAYSTRNSDLNSLNANRDFLLERLAYTTTEQGKVTTSKDSIGYAATLGYRVSAHLAFEGTYSKMSRLQYRSTQQGYVSLTDFTTNPPTEVPYPGQAKVGIDIDDSALQIDALYIIPHDYRWEFYGRGGIVVASTRVKVRIDDPLGVFKPELSNSSNTYHVGVGFAYSLWEVYGLRFEYNHAFDVGGNVVGGKHDIDSLSLGVIVAF
jgi:opacity protein-like surface antigen